MVGDSIHGVAVTANIIPHVGRLGTYTKVASCDYTRNRVPNTRSKTGHAPLGGLLPRDRQSMPNTARGGLDGAGAGTKRSWLMTLRSVPTGSITTVPTMGISFFVPER